MEAMDLQLHPLNGTAKVAADTTRSRTTEAMSSANSTVASSSGVDTGASVGLVGAVVFFIVIIIIIIIRNRKGKCQHDQEEAPEDDGVSIVSEETESPKAHSNVTEMIGSIYRESDYKVRYRKSSCISDPDMRALVEEMLINPARLSLGAIIGKGRGLLARRYRHGCIDCFACFACFACVTLVITHSHMPAIRDF